MQSQGAPPQRSLNQSAALRYRVDDLFASVAGEGNGTHARDARTFCFVPHFVWQRLTSTLTMADDSTAYFNVPVEDT